MILKNNMIILTMERSYINRYRKFTGAWQKDSRQRSWFSFG